MLGSATLAIVVSSACMIVASMIETVMKPRCAGAAPTHRGFITVSIMLATIMQALDTTIANVALPNMQGSFSVAQDQVAWVLTSYIVAAAVATPPIGWLAMRYGRKRLFLLSVAVLLDINPREKHGQAMAIWGAGIMLGPILGPTLGGWLTDSYNWRWVFYINLPIGILCFLGISGFLSETTTSRGRPFDFFGFAMLSIAVGAAQLLLDRGELKDWFGSIEIQIYCGLAVACLWVFAVWNALAEHPFLNLALLKDRNFVVGCFFISVIGVVLYGTLALMPPFLHDLLNYPTVTTGLLLAPRGIATMAAMLIVGRLSGKVDNRLMLLFGFIVTSYSLWQMAGFTLAMDVWPIIVNGLVQGFGLGFLFVPLTTITFATLDPKLRTKGAGIFSLVRNLGASIGISFVESALARGIQIGHQSFAEKMTPYNPALMDPSVQAYWNIHMPAGLAALNGEVTRQAAMQSYVNVFLLIMVITIVSVPLLLMLRRAARPMAAEESPAAE